ncbi:TadE/TadG family type IV pilus assembly protein [Rhizobium sp. Rhizsp82]|uniref:TadE/TadG family type IV pilus assembly protein n=1 Tax=Rhizobium sp. Rhizsp82 TaxID=3243057 RepID=UPI0039B3ADF4
MTMKLLKRFLRADDGVAAIEFALVAPLILTLFLGSVILALLFRDAKTAERATSVISDVISRKTTVDSTYLNQCYTLFQSMVNRPASAIRFRISSVKKSASGLKVDWSYAVTWQQLTDGDVTKRTFPMISDNDSFVVVESSVQPSPLSGFLSLPIGNYENAVTERPRFTAAITKTN